MNITPLDESSFTTKQREKLAKERAQFQRFGEVFPAAPSGPWTQADRDGIGPDFITADGNLGVEVTELLHGEDENGSHFKAQEAIRTKCLKLAMNNPKVQSAGLMVIAYFDMKIVIDPSSINEVAEAIADVLRSRSPQVGETINLNRDNGELPRCVRNLQLQRSGDAAPPRFYAADCGNAESGTVKLIQYRIDDKNAKVKQYRERSAEVWLLLVIDGGKASSWIEVGPSVTSNRYASSFNRVFVLQALEGKCIELKGKAQ